LLAVGIYLNVKSAVLILKTKIILIPVWAVFELVFSKSFRNRNISRIEWNVPEIAGTDIRKREEITHLVLLQQDFS
jgi:hypothetical protein